MLIIKNSFRLLKKLEVKDIGHVLTPKIKENSEIETSGIDDRKRTFLKLAGMVGAGVIASQLLPKKAEALVFGSTPASNTVGLKDTGNLKINPAKEDGNLATLATNIPAKGQAAMVASMPVVIASNQTAIPVTGSFSIDEVGIKDATNTRISPFSEDSVVYLRRIVKLMESQATVDSSNRQRVTVDSPTNANGVLVAQATAANLNATVVLTTGTASIGYLAAGTNIVGSVLIDGQGRQMFTDAARQAYNSGIRSSLIFS